MPSSLSLRVSLVAQRTMKEAFEDLERSMSTSDRESLREITLDKVRQAAHNIQDQLGARQCLRNMRRLEPLFDGLGHYSKSIEVLCNGTPYLPWVWAPIKLILKISSDFIQAFEKIINGYARIAESLGRFAVLNDAFCKEVNVQQSLAVFYSDILKFHKEAYKFVRRSGWRVLFLSSWGRFERRFNGIIEDLKAHEDLIDKTANAVNIAESQIQRREALEILAKEEEKLTTDHYLAIIGWLKFNVCDQPKILESITSEAVDGTCSWALQQEKIAAFMRCSKETSFLVLHGHPGTGKSVLTSQIARFLMASESSLVITHFCTYSYAMSTEYDQILGSILNGLIRGNADLAAHAYQELIVQKKPSPPQVLKELVVNLILAATLVPSRTRYIHIILDGLDECSRHTQLEVFKLLERIVSETSQSGMVVCKVLFSTRGLESCARRLKHKQKVSLEGEKSALSEAIRIYSSERLATPRLASKLKALRIVPAEVHKLEHLIAKKADGMFLWSRLVLDHLETNLFINQEELLEAAERLPKELSEFYGQILTNMLKGFDDRSVARARSVLGWVAFAKRPLRKAEFRSAVAFADGHPDVSHLAPEYFIEACAPLVEERIDSTFTFIHISVREFLESPDSSLVLNSRAAYYEQGFAVATCLLSGFKHLTPSQPEYHRNLRIVSGIHALQTYATEYWTEYLLSLSASAGGLDVESPFFVVSRTLVHELNRLCPPENHESDPHEPLDHRLPFLDREPYRELHHAVRDILLDRKLAVTSFTKAKDLRLLEASPEVTNLTSLLAFFQHSIRVLLNYPRFQGMTLQEFEKFKQDFRSTAFSCRCWSCPRVSLGFDTAEQLLEHEASHCHFVCRDTACQAPPFSSERALKAHQSECHTQCSPRLRRQTIRLQHGSAARRHILEPPQVDVLTSSDQTNSLDLGKGNGFQVNVPSTAVAVGHLQGPRLMAEWVEFAQPLIRGDDIDMTPTQHETIPEDILLNPLFWKELIESIIPLIPQTRRSWNLILSAIPKRAKKNDLFWTRVTGNFSKITIPLSHFWFSFLAGLPLSDITLPRVWSAVDAKFGLLSRGSAGAINWLEVLSSSIGNLGSDAQRAFARGVPNMTSNWAAFWKRLQLRSDNPLLATIEEVTSMFVAVENKSLSRNEMLASISSSRFLRGGMQRSDIWSIMIPKIPISLLGSRKFWKDMVSLALNFGSLTENLLHCWAVQIPKASTLLGHDLTPGYVFKALLGALDWDDTPSQDFHPGLWEDIGRCLERNYIDQDPAANLKEWGRVMSSIPIKVKTKNRKFRKVVESAVQGVIATDRFWDSEYVTRSDW